MTDALGERCDALAGPVGEVLQIRATVTEKG